MELRTCGTLYTNGNSGDTAGAICCHQPVWQSASVSPTMGAAHHIGCNSSASYCSHVWTSRTPMRALWASPSWRGLGFSQSLYSWFPLWPVSHDPRHPRWRGSTTGATSKRNLPYKPWTTGCPASRQSYRYVCGAYIYTVTAASSFWSYDLQLQGWHLQLLLYSYTSYLCAHAKSKY